MSIFSKIFGGGNSGAVTQSIPEWLRPYMEKASGAATEAYDKGELSKVAGENQNLTTGFNMGQTMSDTTGKNLGTLDEQQARLLQMAQTGNREQLQSALDLNLGKSDATTNTQFGQAGTLGSARNALAADTAKGGIIAQNEQQILANKMGAEQALAGNVANEGSLVSGTANTLTGLGTQERAVDQSQLDAPWQGIQRMSSAVYGNPAKQTAMGGK